MKHLFKNSKKYFFVTFFLFILSLLWIFYTYNDKFQYQVIKNVTYNNIDSQKEYSEAVSSNYKDVDISFSLFVDSKDNIVDIFQTGSLGTGLIMRFSQPGLLQIIIGYDNLLGNKVYSLTDSFEYNKAHAIKVIVTKEKHLWVAYDDILVINTYDKNINFDVSKFRLGQFFHDEKITKSTISNLKYTYTLFRTVPAYSIVKKIMTLIFFVLSFQLLKKNIRIFSREERIKYTAFILVVGFLMAVFYLIGQSILGYTYPKNTFLFNPGNMFSDFIGPVNNPDIITYSFFMASIKLFFYHFGTEISLVLFLVGSIAFLTLINIKEIAGKKFNTTSIFYAAVFSLLSYPVLFAINRGNFELWVFVLLYLFSYYLNQKRFIRSAIFLSLAISLKIFPAVFLIVMLSCKKFKAAIYACLFTLCTTLISLAVFASRSSHNVSKLISQYVNTYTIGYVKEYVVDNRGLDFGHSLYGLLKLRIFSFYKTTNITDVTLKKITTLLNSYTRIQISLLVILSAYILFIEKELWKKITLMVIAMNLLPFVSSDYKLINFFIPLYLFINKKEKSRIDFLYIILFSLLLVPKNYYTVLLNLPDTSLSVLLNPLIMIILALFILFEGFKNMYVRKRSSYVSSVI